MPVPTPRARPRWTTWLFIGLPVWLVLSAGFAIWFQLRKGADETSDVPERRFVQMVSEKQVADDLEKLLGPIGERNGSSETSARNLGRAAAFISGSLGPSNTGYNVSRHRGPADWPLIEVSVPGTKTAAPPLWLVAAYDSPPVSPGAENNTSGVAALLAAARELAADETRIPIRLVFLPHFNDPDSPKLETARILLDHIGKSGGASRILCVETMGLSPSLWLTARDTQLIPPAENLLNLATVHGAETVCLSDDSDLASLLHEIGLPALRIATGPVFPVSEAPEKLPAPDILTRSATALVELVRRLANAP